MTNDILFNTDMNLCSIIASKISIIFDRRLKRHYTVNFFESALPNHFNKIAISNSKKILKICCSFYTVLKYGRLNLAHYKSYKF
ncbi:hypothetical protein BpHYR1_025217 [Brachionus plicatilis]|uniref:Uncharacterized protein n=1 Tax=Brachionus plicatilis TaxID=10195 RepID=A0A3M7QKN3_BRAPC|nr:hypothetical protein BpHYR1_025217 [Brachionus plicatilis]